MKWHESLAGTLIFTVLFFLCTMFGAWYLGVLARIFIDTAGL